MTNFLHQAQINGDQIATRTPAPRFSIEELATLQYYCWKYARYVRGGGTPTSEQDARFRAFSDICIASGVDHVEP